MNKTFQKGLRVILLLTVLLINLGLENVQTVYAAVPTNDNIGGATLIVGLTYTDTVNTTDAAPDDPYDTPTRGPCSDVATYLNEGYKSLWYTYTPPENQSIQTDTFGSQEIGNTQQLDTYIVVWKKISVDPAPLALELVGCNDDTLGVTSRLTFAGIKNVVYYFEVAEYAGENGTTYGTAHAANMKFNVNITNTDVTIGDSLMGKYYIHSGTSDVFRYGINGGPVHVYSPGGQDIFTSQRAVQGISFNSLAGYPANQLTTEYWFTSLDDLSMVTWLVIGNPNPVGTPTAYVDVYIGNTKMNTTPYAIAPGERTYPRYGINGGPVRVVSVTGPGTTSPVKIFTSERAHLPSSFNELMGFPADQFHTEYWFTSLDDLGMVTWLVIGNPNPVGTPTAYVDVYIGNTKMNTTPYAIAPGERTYPRYGINGGPVRVVSITGAGTPTPVKIFTSERAHLPNSFNELMGFPADQFYTEYWFTSLDDLNMVTWLVIGNPNPVGTPNALVDVYIGGTKMNTTPYSIAPGARVFPRYGINGGPVRVVSITGAGTPTPVTIFTSERAHLPNSFDEMMGIPADQLTTDYWYTSLDDFGMKTELVISRP